ncbi:TolC family protein [Chroococcidiopsis sp. CCMEE 29]|uniref:TolC family protein n=1 Tax=Chroococcidiopsis sp. CCMEE 29 TaxID=155894 RepID=UPI00202043DF|nr:TolC family protein [Chroococcidiopsis sp. CCMEE 29]
MKRLQIFNSFWPSLTALLATQPAWADTVPVTGVRLNPTLSGVEVILETPSNTSPRVLASSFGRTFSANLIDTQLHVPQGKSFRATNPTAGISGVTVKPMNANSIRVIVTGKADLPVGQMVRSDRGLVFSLKTNSKTSWAPAPSRPAERNQLQLASTKVGQQPQAPPPATPPAPAAPVTPAPATPTPAAPATPAPNTDIRTPALPTPNYLNPSPNPLRLPTQPEEVRVLGAQPITLQQAIDLAERNNRELQTARLALERSQAALREAQAALYPDLSVGAGITNSGRNVFSDQDDTFTGAGQIPGLNLEGGEGSATALSGTLSLNYDLFTAGSRQANIRRTEEQLRLQQLDVERLSEEVRLNVSNDYYGLQQADEQVRINQAAVINAQASLRDAQALEQAGVGTRFDVLQAQVELANSTQNLTNAVSQQQIARRQLATRLSVPQSILVTAAEPVEIAGLWNFSLEQSLVQAFQNRAELVQQLAQRNIAEQNRRIALAQIRPQIGLSATYNVRDTFDDQRNFTDNYSLGANVSLNLYDGGAARARARQEEANIAIAETNFAEQRNQIGLQVEEAFADLQSEFANIQTASVALEQAREALRLARLRFQAGVGTQTDVITQQNALTQAEGNRVNAILNYNRALARLQRSISAGQPR